MTTAAERRAMLAAEDARLREAERVKRKATRVRVAARFRRYTDTKAANLAANGNPNRAESYRAFWDSIVCFR